MHLSQILVERMPTVDLVRFANSGTEAVMMAVRVARAYTGRPLIAKAEGGYHGTWDDITVSVAPPLDQAGPVERPTPYLDSKGLNPKVRRDDRVDPVQRPRGRARDPRAARRPPRLRHRRAHAWAPAA